MSRQDKGASLRDRAVVNGAASVSALRPGAGSVCGYNTTLPARLVGCGKPIMAGQDYRCTHCGVRFHKDCAERHFKSDNVFTQEMLDSITDEEMAALSRAAVVAPAWEAFADPAYFDMWCVREVGERRFGHGFHLVNADEAHGLCDLLNAVPTGCAQSPESGA